MSFSNNSQNDPIDAMLGRKDRSSNGDSLRAAVLSQTVGVIRRRRRLKRCVVAATLMGCYLAGMATMAYWRPGAENLSKPSTAQVAIQDQLKLDLAASLPPGRAGAPDQKAASKPVSQFEILRRAGDRYLQDPEKLQLAVRSYSRALKYASADQRAISPEQDTWLLMALKDAQSKEKKHENSQL
jgi:hypothetical protein